MTNSLQYTFAHYIEREQLLKPENKVLAAVSGGIDSMVMLQLLHAIGIDCTVAHCNFGLRGNESDEDELFIHQKAAEFGIPVYTTRFDTIAYAGKNGISIQMAARELRYRWFDELASKFGYSCIAVAHNRDDRIETLFINLARGTGIHGLAGIQPRNGRIIRPLLFASRDEIITYSQQKNIIFREDSSNSSDKYARNYIRHHLIPGLSQYFPGLQQTIEREIEQFSGIKAFYDEIIDRFRQQIVSRKEELMYIDLPGLIESPSPSTLLFEIIKPYGFSNAVIGEILGAIPNPGRQFFSHTHRLVCDRQAIIIQSLSKDISITCEYSIEANVTRVDIPVNLRLRYFKIDNGFKPRNHPHIACLDGDKLYFPLTLRHWQQGDKFQPLGMNSMKKLSDYFTDKKFPLIEKEKVWVLTSAGQIVWIIGHRMDDRFKITNETTHVVELGYSVE